MTKPVTVAAAMTLLDEGRLALKDPVVHWAPELADVRVWTRRVVRWAGPIRRNLRSWSDLLTHPTGLAYGSRRQG